MALVSHTKLITFTLFQVDIFVIDSVFLGKLSSMRIGHSETKLGKQKLFPVVNHIAAFFSCIYSV